MTVILSSSPLYPYLISNLKYHPYRLGEIGCPQHTHGSGTSRPGPAALAAPRHSLIGVGVLAAVAAVVALSPAAVDERLLREPHQPAGVHEEAALHRTRGAETPARAAHALVWGRRPGRQVRHRDTRSLTTQRRREIQPAQGRA